MKERPSWVTHELPLLACLALIWALSDQPSLPGPGERGSLLRDLFNYGSHALIYGIVGVLAWRVILRRAAVLPRLIVAHPRISAALFALAWGLLDEYHQSFIPGRTASVWDALTDLAGAALALWLVPWGLALLQRMRRCTPEGCDSANDLSITDLV